MSMSDLEVLQFISLKMLYAVICGAIVGIERRLNNAPAGLKTQVLVCVGSMLFTVSPIIAGPLMMAEAPRVMGQIVTGIGFLGAGTIIHSGSRSVLGLTTAAWIWFTAAIGILIGLDHGAVALFITITLAAVVSLFRHIEQRFFTTPKIEEAKEKPEDIRKAS